jgi:hypothetical protein
LKSCVSQNHKPKILADSTRSVAEYWNQCFVK